MLETEGFGESHQKELNGLFQNGNFQETQRFEVPDRMNEDNC